MYFALSQDHRWTSPPLTSPGAGAVDAGLVGNAGGVGAGGERYVRCEFGVSHFMLCAYSPMALTSFRIWLSVCCCVLDSCSILF
jgi:hypothetical protein